MPNTETVLSVFVASPTDVSEERHRLQDVLVELNSTIGRHCEINYRLLKFERDTIPAFGEDAQAVINSQIPEYDILICILWHRIGSRTGRAQSGTIEEYDQAKSRYDDDPDSVNLMLYFKTSPPLSMKDIDAEQLKGVEKFRERVKEEGAYYAEFSTSDDFANQVRVHLTNLTISRKAGCGSGEQPSGTESVSSIETGDGDQRDEVDDGDEEGLLDLHDSFEVAMEALVGVVERMAEAIDDIGSSTRGEASKIKCLTEDIDLSNIGAQQKRIIRDGAMRSSSQVAIDMNEFVRRMRLDIPLFKRHLDASISSFTKSVVIHVEMGEDKGIHKDEVEMVMNAIEGMVCSMEGFRVSVHSLPRMTTKLNRARKATEEVLQETIDVAHGGKASLEGILSALR